MHKEMDLFSRTLDKQHYDNAVAIQKKVGGTLPPVTTYGLYSGAFTNPEVAAYDTV